jgi:CDGSH-type Zn-finger protein
MEIFVKSMKNGPNVVSVDGQAKFALCRCGHSNNKPLCDGMHQKVDFQADEKETKII